MIDKYDPGPFDDVPTDGLLDRVDDVVQSIGRGITTFAIPMPWGDCPISAGPYLDFPFEDKKYFGVKCAAEIDMPYMVSLDIKDFRTPDPYEAADVVFLAMAAMRVGMIPYVGCMGGLGRTGTVLGILAKVSLQSTRRRVLGVPMPWAVGGDPVEWVRTHYTDQAIETMQQEAYVRDFEVRWLVRMAVSMG